MSKFTDQRLFRLAFMTAVLMLIVTPLLLWANSILSAPLWLILTISLLGCALTVNKFQKYIR